MHAWMARCRAWEECGVRLEGGRKREEGRGRVRRPFIPIKSNNNNVITIDLTQTNNATVETF